MTSELVLIVLEVVAIYNDLSDVERSFRQLKHVLAMRPIYHHLDARVKAHIFVAALALLVQRLLDRRLEEAGINFSARGRWTPSRRTLGDVSHGRSTGTSRGQWRLPGRPPGPQGIEVDDLKPPTPPEGEETVM